MSSFCRHRPLVLAASVLDVAATARPTALSACRHSSSTKRFNTVDGADPAAAYKRNPGAQQRVTSYVEIVLDRHGSLRWVPETDISRSQPRG